MNERKKDKLFWLIILLLLIIIVLLLFFTKFGKIENKYLVPTGNVDIFNIDIDCICNDGECDNKDNNWIWVSSNSTLTVGDTVKMWMFTNYTDDNIYDDSIESIKILKKSTLR